MLQPAPEANVYYERNMNIDERLDRLTGIVETLATAVAHVNKIEAHDRQIESLVKIVEKLSVQVAATEQQWRAYINTLPRQ